MASLRVTWNRLLNKGLQEGAYLENTKVRTLNAFLLWSVMLLGVFVITNLVTGLYFQIFIDLVLISIILLLYNKNDIRTFSAIALIFINLCIVGISFSSVLAYQEGRFTGVENILYPFIAVSTLLLGVREDRAQTAIIFMTLLALKSLRRNYQDMPYDGEFVTSIIVVVVAIVGLILFTRTYRRMEDRAVMYNLQQKEILFSLIDNVPLFMALISPDKRYVAINQRLLKAYGKTREEVIGQPCDLFLEPEVYQKYVKLFNRALAGEIVEIHDEVYNPKKGKTVIYTGRYIPVYDAHGKVKYISQYMTDITELKEAEQSLIEANSTKDKLFSIVAHDIRSPIAQLSSMLALDKQIQLSKEDFLKYKETISDKVDVLKFTIDNILNWSRSQMKGVTVNPERVEVSQLVQENIDLHKELAGMKGIDFQTEYDQNTFGWMDPDHLRLVLRNVMHNAIKFTPHMGRIDIGVTPDDEYLKLTISDSGVGMGKDKVKKILKGKIEESSSGTAGESGTGVGLNLSVELLQLNHCHLDIKSKEGEGTTFEIGIPVKD